MNEAPSSHAASEGPFTPTPSITAITDPNDPLSMGIVASTHSFSHLHRSSAIASSVSTGTCTLDATSNQWDIHASSHQLAADEHSIATPSVYSVEIVQQLQAAEGRLNTCTSADFASRTNLLDTLSVASHMNITEDFSSRTNLADVASAASRINFVEELSVTSHSFGAAGAIRVQSTCSSAFDFAALTPTASTVNTLSPATSYRNTAEFSPVSLGSCSELQIPSSVVVASKLNHVLHEHQNEGLEVDDSNSKPSLPQNPHVEALGVALTKLTLSPEGHSAPSESFTFHSDAQPEHTSAQPSCLAAARATETDGVAQSGDSDLNHNHRTGEKDVEPADGATDSPDNTGAASTGQENELSKLSMLQSSVSLFEKAELSTSLNHSISASGANRRGSLAPTLGSSATPDSSSNLPSALQSPRPSRRPPTRECRSVSICDVGDGIMQV